MKKVCAETGKVYISSCENVSDIAGQGTCGLELIRQVPDLDAVLVSISGGGLSAGIAVAVKSIKPDCKIYLVTPRGRENDGAMLAFWREGVAQPSPVSGHNCGGNQATADRAKGIQNPERSDEEIIAGMKFTFNHMKQVIEAAAGATVAALFTEKMAALPASIKKVAVISCGGNVDIDNLPWYESYVNPFKMGDII
ncbi:hypothetical protein EB796_018710 [Bugula neritina]|uniref:Tryptophan synthase beta chain-like PALP domain-containing protein n=1 Tax=Bugula neritina TaxID=10212 RepID=A0A7J7J9S4_BUGNE|nr:hypothetical protein EB796_018710 [Bugula neritina]